MYIYIYTEQRHTCGQTEIDLEPGDMITRRGKAVLEWKMGLPPTATTPKVRALIQ